ncbi:hypothetical protein [Bailinhaonella thermotolerans]|uniref:Uncharacterized protein n=1 Tax=Bailinhaonella thermotolerans TaxID=1070861 RepID=A0A3A4ANI0_9ACTN|nr:hypothetical protein [Bailinhaonella thermotolerans]RJL30521.1 hypothetical protein D5H75_23495 [Bailinhaonella thermotolerans]
MVDVKNLRWPLVIGLGALALIRPLLSALGVLEALGKPWSVLVVTALISLAWLAAVVAFDVARPLLTLVAAGLVYGALALVLGLTAGTISGEGGGLALLNPFAIVSVLATNALWGGVTGLVALAIQKARGRA